MNRLLSLYYSTFGTLDKAAPLIPLLARFLFAAILLSYFWASALTKVDGVGLSSGAYAQIFPRAFEAAGYDTGALGLFHTLVVAAGTLAEFLLPALIILGLFTRAAALGMVGFVVVQTLTDLFGHRVIEEASALGQWFDKHPDSLILDQRGLWIFLLLTLTIKGAGPLSLDRWLRARQGAAPLTA
ncbi:DoxX family protein [Rhodalgimonas zhirmunskyi]|uniref:DoxX family protein n=1 Tax=Rhodalgimonas zhirmunskyi TaxID=2964767 RepID=A0AAJ1U814_9RHOB|nr:DoxX family protein [Rhodoalgimonas zhirmunskyi]MDQ2093420.1 DoxX family protein [Rhodoalgimonas zhirmunskyi]